MLYDTESGSVARPQGALDARRPGRAMVAGLVELCGAGRRRARRTSTPSSTARRSRRTPCSSTAGAVAGMITTRGFRDVVHIGRHQRPQHYSVMQDIPWQARPFVQRRHRKVVSERIVPPTGEVARAARRGRGARRGARAARGRASRRSPSASSSRTSTRSTSGAPPRSCARRCPDAFVTTSADIVPQFREFERFTTAHDERVRRPGDRPLPRAARGGARRRGRRRASCT